MIAEPGVELRWAAKLAFGGLFDGTHYFRLEESDGVTVLEHGEDFKGILIPFMGKVLRRNEKGYQAFNEALKNRSEVERHN